MQLKSTFCPKILYNGNISTNLMLSSLPSHYIYTHTYIQVYTWVYMKFISSSSSDATVETASANYSWAEVFLAHDWITWRTLTEWTDHRNSWKIHLDSSGRRLTVHAHLRYTLYSIPVCSRLLAFCSVWCAIMSCTAKMFWKCRPTWNLYHEKHFSGLTEHYAAQVLQFG